MIKKKSTCLSLIPAHIYLPLIVAFLWNQLVYCGSRMLMKNHFHYDLTTTMDSFIPVIPWTLAIYVFSFIYWPCQLPDGKRTCIPISECRFFRKNDMPYLFSGFPNN